MSEYQRLDAEQALAIMERPEALVVDVRDEQSFRSGRLPGACHLSNDNLAEFIENTDTTVPVLVYCYHGHSSQGAAAMLSGQGFNEVYSIDGGFEAWRGSFPVEDTTLE
jgi:thiosulfate sulfurtransferase